jgi:ubiquinol oxidase
VTVLLDRAIPTQRTAPSSYSALRVGQQETLAAPRRNYSLFARFLFVQMDLLYGRKSTIRKFRVLEVVARLPYRAWEKQSQKQLNRVDDDAGTLASLMHRIRTFRSQQDNEQWHLDIMEELLAQSGEKLGFLKQRLLPRIISFGYWHFCWLLYAIKPRWSHRLNADFEDHAEHTYAEFVLDNPQLETTPWQPVVCAAYGSFASQADLFRQICLDERSHKHESEVHL